MTDVPNVLGCLTTMKIGFSSLVCPGWDLETIVTNAAEYGFDGVELRGLRGELNLPLAPELSADPNAVRQLFDEKGVELVCLGSSASLDSRDPKELARQKDVITQYVELAAKLGCPFVRVHAGEVQRLDNQRAAQARIAQGLISVAPVAVKHGVTLLIENGGDFPSSDATWFFVDAVEFPAVRCCWNQCNGMIAGEHPTTSIPRLGSKIGMVHVCDADFDDQHLLVEHKMLGEGQAGVARQIELLKGLLYDRYLMFEWPKLWDASLPAPETALPAVAKFLREQVDAEQKVLTAYKSDKRPPKFAPRTPSQGAEG